MGNTELQIKLELKLILRSYSTSYLSVTQSMSRLWQDPLEQPASSSKIEIRIDGLM